MAQDHKTRSCDMITRPVPKNIKKQKTGFYGSLGIKFTAPSTGFNALEHIFSSLDVYCQFKT